MPEPTYRHLTSRTEGNVLVLTLTDSQVRGDDLAAELLDELLAATAGTDRVVLDMQHVAYLSSAGFRTLLLLYRALKEHGGRVVLCNLCAYVKDVLHQTRVISTHGWSQAPFEEQPDVAAAVAHLTQPA